MEIKMDGVEEYSEGYPVSLTIESGEIVIHAINQGGYDSTNVSLFGLLGWLAENAQQCVHLTAFGVGMRGFFVRLFLSWACKLASSGGK